MNTRQDVGKILGFHIEPNEWDTITKRLDANGLLTMKQAWNIIFYLCKRLEEAEKNGKL